MDIDAFVSFNAIGDGETIHWDSGTYLRNGHIEVKYPEYTGLKAAWYEYYTKIAEFLGWHPSETNEIFHHIISTIKTKEDK